MAFGIFDHVDRGDEPLASLYEHRLKLVEAADAAGFRTYHVAEHHATRLGMAPSPGIYLAAVAQRTRRIRFGPLVYILPLYTPLRLIEEICSIPFRFAESLERALEIDAAIVGSPQTVRAEVERHLSATGCNYFVGRFIYGTLGYEQARRSLDLWSREVMPHFQGERR